jgi:Xaa-Pro aminopeptidase
LTSIDEILDWAMGAYVHQTAADVIEKEGNGKYFIHGLGHGVGLEVYEGPSLGSTSEDVLRKGNIVADEPGIYIHGFRGVRIEDTLLVTESKPVRLTKMLKGL